MHIQKNGKRYVDGNLMLWNESKERLNGSQTLQFTIEYNLKQLPYLDIPIKNVGNTIETYKYLFQCHGLEIYLSFNTCDMKHTRMKNSYKLAERICAIVSDTNTRYTQLAAKMNRQYEPTYP